MILGGEHSRTCSAGDVPGQWLFSICTTPTPQLDLARSIINASLAGMRTYGRVSLKIQRRQSISLWPSSIARTPCLRLFILRVYAAPRKPALVVEAQRT